MLLVRVQVEIGVAADATKAPRAVSRRSQCRWPCGAKRRHRFPTLRSVFCSLSKKVLFHEAGAVGRTRRTVGATNRLNSLLFPGAAAAWNPYVSLAWFDLSFMPQGYPAYWDYAGSSNWF